MILTLAAVLALDGAEKGSVGAMALGAISPPLDAARLVPLPYQCSATYSKLRGAEASAVFRRQVRTDSARPTAPDA